MGGIIMKLMDEIIEGIFLYENKNRFLCKVLINETIEECYIPSSSRLDKYINLRNKNVLLTKNKSTGAKTQYSVFAVKYYNRYIMLNLSIVNRFLKDEIRNLYKDLQFDDIYTERYIEDYKADIVLGGNSNLIIEAKGLIATSKSAIFPSVYSQRSIDQLKKIKKLLCKGHIVNYYYVSLSPIVREITVNNSQKEYKELLRDCIRCGLVVKGLSLIFKDNNINFYKSVTINI